jgi:hypothetical protein
VSAAGGPLFRFVQAEFPWALGPPDGRYVLRGHAGVPAHVLMIHTLGAAERRTVLGRRQRRAREASPSPEPTPVVTDRARRSWPRSRSPRTGGGALAQELDPEAEAAAALRVLNRVLHAQRVATADPYVREVAGGRR